MIARNFIILIDFYCKMLQDFLLGKATCRAIFFVDMIKLSIIYCLSRKESNFQPVYILKLVVRDSEEAVTDIFSLLPRSCGLPLKTKVCSSQFNLSFRLLLPLEIKVSDLRISLYPLPRS